MTAHTSSLSSCVAAVSSAARVSVEAPCGRLSLRARGDLSALEGALGLALPRKVGGRAAAGELQALCLGPDEWMLHAPLAAVSGLVEACAGVYGALPHSLVDVSGREVSFQISGPRAAELLTLGCARDIDTIAVGEGRRTLFDGSTVILWRDAADSFRMDVWNSFASHLLHLLEVGVRELAAEAL